MSIIRLLKRAEKAMETPLGRKAFWLACAAVFIIFGVITVVRAEFPKRKYVARLRYDSPMIIGTDADKQAKYHSSEFYSFRRQAWGVIVRGMDPYDAEHFNVRAYPPFFNLAFMPFAALWRLTGAGSALFYVLSFGAGLLCAWCLSRCLGPDQQSRFGLFALLFVFLLPMALNVMARCETDMFVLASLAVALMLLMRRKLVFAAGLLIGLAAAFKILPGLFGVYLICRRKWVSLAGMIVAMALCTILLPAIVFGPSRAWELHRSWYRQVVRPYHTEGADAVIGQSARPSNQSLAAALKRALTPVPVKLGRKTPKRAINLITLSPKTVQSILKISQCVIGLGLIALWIFSAHRHTTPRTTAVLFASVVPGILLLSDVSLTSHHVLLILPLGVMLVRALVLGDRNVQSWAWVVALYLVVLLGVAIPIIKAFTPMLPLTLMLLAACVTLAYNDSRISPDGSNPSLRLDVRQPNSKTMPE